MKNIYFLTIYNISPIIFKLEMDRIYSFINIVNAFHVVIVII